MGPSPIPLPARILLATDLSARCDRALDRAAQLAGEWHAELTALNVVEPAATFDQALAWASGAGDEEAVRLARRQLNRHVAGAGGAAALRVARGGEPAEVICEAAQELDAGLVVTGVARDEALGRILLGSTVERLARTLTRPLLVVRNRPAGPYRRIVVATDFSDGSRHALRAVLSLFAGRAPVLYHACEQPLAAAAADPSPGGSARDVLVGHWAAFLADTGIAAGDASMVIEHGAVEAALTRYVREHEVDLVAVGPHAGSGLMSLLLGSTAAKLLDWLPCDVLLARPQACHT